MRWFLFFLVLFCAVPSWAGGYWVSEEQLTALEETLNQQIRRLSDLRSELSESQKLLKESELKLEQSGKELTQASEELTKSREDLNRASESLKQLEVSRLTDLLLVGAGSLLLGGLLGFILGLGY